MLYQINIESHRDWLDAGTLDLPEGASNEQVLLTLLDAGKLNRNAKLSQLKLSHLGTLHYVDFEYHGVVRPFVELVPADYFVN